MVGADSSVFATKAYTASTYAPMAAVGSPLVANAVADMTDTEKVYVYTGSETGYTSGNWYYYNGSAWVSGGTYNSQGISDGSITTAKLADGAVTTAKIADGAVTDDKLASGGVKDAVYNYVDVSVSKNLYNPATKMDGYQLYSSGAPGANASYNFTGYIDIDGLEYITVMLSGFSPAGANTQYAFYNSSKSPVTTRKTDVVTGTAKTLEVPEGAAYFGLAYIAQQLTSSSTIMVQAGSEATPYQPYGQYYYDLKDKRPLLWELWGDSLTQGNQDSTGVSRASVLRSLLGDTWTVKGYGVGGEKSNTIAVRASGIFAQLTPGLTIPADTTAVEVTDYLRDQFGNVLNLGSGLYSSAYSGWTTVNPCYVDNIKCELTKADISSPVMLHRLEPGAAYTITRPTYIRMNSLTFEPEPVLSICIGQNEGFNRDIDELICQIDGIINQRKATRYIVFGMVHALYGYTWQKAFNDKLKFKYGKHFYDIEAYMKTPIYEGEDIVSSYALQDAGLTPTEADLANVAENKYPPSIMFDGVHFNQYGYTVWANREYELAKWLGYCG